MAAIPNITHLALQAAWKEVRAGLKRAPYRDVLDHIEFDIDHEVWIKRLLERIETGDYTPEAPRRCTVAKSKGFDRIITIPSVPDLVLYRTIVDHLYSLAKGREVKHAYFVQSALAKIVEKAQKAAEAEIENLKQLDFAGYPVSSKWVFLEWLKYDQYRKHLIFEQLYPVIVLTDITNFFDSVLHSRIEESLYEIEAPAKMVSLLFHILECFSLRDEMTPVQRIGLPIDPCDCSRVLAHMMLLPHDRRVTALVGEDAYVRWMDDQNIGVPSVEDGLRALAAVGGSLRKLHLAPNTSKTKILSLAEAKRHFHFQANSRLDELEQMPFSTAQQRNALKTAVSDAWKRAVKNESHGEWIKILKRFYRVAARARSKIFLTRIERDMIEMPLLADRIIDYVRYVESDKRYVDFVGTMLANKQQIYPDVSYQLVDGLLLIDPTVKTAGRIRKFALKLLRTDPNLTFPGVDEARALAPLLLLRYGNSRSLGVLFKLLQSEGASLPVDLLRSVCVVIAGTDRKGVKAVRKAASELLRNHLAYFVKLLQKVGDLEEVPQRFRDRIALSYDSITSAPRVDMRSILATRILGRNGKPKVKAWLKQAKAQHLKANLSDFDRRLVGRLWPET